ncbi:MAG: hypothetical protein QM757_31175 [Paludibaculum sp.]
MNFESDRMPMGMCVPTQTRDVPLKKISGRGAGEDVAVKTLSRIVLGVAEAGAHFVGAAAGPDFARFHRDGRLNVFGRPHRVAAGQFRQGSAIAFRPLYQFAQRVARNRACQTTFEITRPSAGPATKLVQVSSVSRLPSI